MLKTDILQQMFNFAHSIKGIGTIDISRLNKKERDIWFLLESRAGVVFLKGKAGVSKSATAASIARKVFINGQPLRFLDIRLSQKDETYFGFPARKEIGHNFQVMTYALPEWFMRLQEAPTLLNFEELNRCTNDVRNAALEILNERTLHGHKVPVHTFMISTGNLGMDQDGCNVEDFDNALISRLIVVDFDLKLEEWIENFADPEKYPQNNIHYLLIYFLRQNKDHFYSYNKAEEGATITNARSLTNFCQYVGGDASYSDFVSCNKISGAEYFSKETQSALAQWLDNARDLNVDRVKNDLVVYPLFTDSQLQKMAAELKRDLNTHRNSMNPKQLENVENFIEKYLK